jgi:hypothetical protein
VIAKETRSETVIVSGTVLGSENETGIGLLGVVVGTAVRAVPAVVAVGAVGADTVEATATGHWPREWDSNVFSHLNTRWDRPYMNSQPIYGPTPI